MRMLGLLSSDAVVFDVVVGIPVAVAALAVIWARPRSHPAIWGAVSAAILVVSAAGLAAAFREGPEAVQASGHPLSLPGVTQSVSPAPTTCIPKGAALHLVAKNISFDTRCLAAPARSALTVSFDNQDAGITHEFHILTASPTTDPSAGTLFQSKILTGPASVIYHVGSLPPGTYYFQCDVHPTLMNGTFIVR